MFQHLEELIGEIKNPSVKGELETVLSRLVLCGIQPDEAVLLVQTVFENVIEELYYSEMYEDDDGL